MSAEETEIYNRLARLRNQIQLLSISVAEVAYQLLELTNALSSVVSEVKALRAKVRELEGKSDEGGKK